ncbi:MAG: PHP domain-containing protein [Promethearchaeota archaeon]
MKDLPKIDLHIHSNFSDGNNSIPNIVEKSIKLLKIICITDHLTNSWKSNIIPSLNSNEKIENYLDQISVCQKYLYDKDIDLMLLRGVEIDISSSQRYILKLVNPLNFDIILFEYLESPEGIAFINNLLEYWMRRINNEDKPCVFGLAHFDPSFFIHGNLDILIKFLCKYNVFFEFNSSYSHCYSSVNKIFFEKLITAKIPVSIGSDSHHVSTIGNVEEPLEMVQFYNLEDNLRNLITILKHSKEK